MPRFISAVGAKDRSSEQLEGQAAILDSLSRRILHHFGEVIEPATVAKISSYIAPSVAKLTAKPKVARTKAKIGRRHKLYIPVAIAYSRAKYQHSQISNRRLGLEISKRAKKSLTTAASEPIL